ncbi:MAG TPA: hypothetical protein VGK67_17090 [Myxococcales bacterium]|jgi:hypothetical protein
MTVYQLFGTQLFVLYTGLGHLGVVLASAALAALSFTARRRAWSGLDARARASARLAGAGVAGTLALTLLAGLRVQGAAFDPLAPAMAGAWLAAVASGAGLVAAAWAAASGVAAAVLGRSATGRALPAWRAVARDELQAAVAAYQALKASTERLGLAEKAAGARAQQVADGAAAAEYAKAADAIRHRLQLAEELRVAAGAAVARLACGAPVRRVLDRRPDAALARLEKPEEAPALAERADEALASVRAFMAEIETARAEVQREAKGAPGSVSHRLGLDASERAKPFEATLAELEASYGRVGHRIEALRMRLRAEADAGTAAAAAMDIAGERAASRPPDVVEVALQIAQAQQGAAGALAALGAAPSRVTEVVVRASASLARDGGDEEGLADVLRSVQRELE